jgi:hypothetical protein
MSNVARNPLTTTVTKHTFVSKHAYIRRMLKKVVNEDGQIIPATAFFLHQHQHRHIFVFMHNNNNHNNNHNNNNNNNNKGKFFHVHAMKDYWGV